MGHASSAPFAPSLSGASNATPCPTSRARATTSSVGPNQTPTPHASREPSSPPSASPTTSWMPPRRLNQKTRAALTAPNASASSTNVPSAPTASSLSVSLRKTALSVETSGTRGASHSHSSPSATPRTVSARTTAKALATSADRLTSCSPPPPPSPSASVAVTASGPWPWWGQDGSRAAAWASDFCQGSFGGCR